MQIRDYLKVGDRSQIETLLQSTKFFYDYEIAVALELVDDSLEKGRERSSYRFLLAEDQGQVVCFTCYGKTPCTAWSYDLYWIATHQAYQGKGIGRQLLQLTEEQIKKENGRNIWIETSSRPLYEPTRQFYLRNGYQIMARLPEFYGPEDDKVIFLKRLGK